MNRATVVLVSLGFLAGKSYGVVLYDQLSEHVANIGFYSWDGGGARLGHNIGARAGQRVRAVDGGTTITDVTARFDTWHDATGVTGALVQVYELSGDTVGSLVGQSQSSVSITRHGAGFGGVPEYSDDIQASISIPGLVAGNDYLVFLQPQSPDDIGAIIADFSSSHDVFFGDYSSLGYGGYYGGPTFTYAPNEFAYRIEAVPEPTPIAIAGAFLCLAVLRRARAPLVARR